MNNEAPATTDTLAKQLTKKIARLQSDIALRELDHAEVTLALLENPKDPERLAQRDKAVKDIADMRATIEGAEGALALQQSRDLDADLEDAAAARHEAAEEARALMAESLKIAQHVDKAANAFTTALARMDEVNGRIFRRAFDAGLRGDQRHHLLAIRHAGGVLANLLIACGLHNRLDYIESSRPPFPQGTAYADLVKGNIERLDSWIERERASGA